MRKKKVKAKAVQVDERAKQFEGVLMDYVRIEEGHPEVQDDGTIGFPARVGEREMDVYCWFKSETSRAHITIFFYDVYPPSLVNEVAEFMKPILAVPRNVGGKLSLSFSGHVKWMGYCQLKPTDSIDLSLAKELVAVGITESNRLVDQISAFVAGRSSVGSTASAEWTRPFMNGSLPKKEPLN